MAQVIVRDLVESPDVTQVAICGRSLEKSKSFANDLRESKAYPIQVDITDKNRLGDVIKDFDVVINASWYEYNLKVMQVAINSGVSYVDLGGLYHVTLEQLRLNEEARKMDVTCLLGMGSTPGTMNVMAAYAAGKLDTIEEARLRSGYSIVGNKPETFQMPYSLRTVLDEFTKPAPILREGKITTVPPISTKEKFVLPDPVGEIEGYFTIHSELATLPANLNKGIKEMNFIVAYEPEFTKTVSAIVKLGLADRKEIEVGDRKISPFEVTSTLINSLPKEEVMDVDVQMVEMEGKKGNERIDLKVYAISFPHKRWSIGGGTVDTGVPPSIAAQWIAKGKISTRGVVPPELCVDPLPYFKELNLRDRGIKVYEDYDSQRPLF